MPTLHLLRHGAILQTAEHRFIGQQDLPLSRQGELQAHVCRQELISVPLTEVWTSDLSRCTEMTTIIMEKRNVIIHRVPAFREICLGRWEGHTKTEVETLFPGAIEARGKDFWNYEPKGGESFAMLARRTLPPLLACLCRLKEHAHVLLVAHAGVNRVIIMQYMALTMRDFFSIPQPYASCTTLSYKTEELARLAASCRKLCPSSGLQ